MAAAGVVPDDRTVVVERAATSSATGASVLSPFGSRIHAPWAMAVVERVRAETGLDVETMWTDDGFVVRFPETDDPPDPRLMLPASEEVEALVLNQLGGTAMFAAKFREAAGRALLLPKRRPGGRSPLWQLRKRASDLLAVASRFGSFPIVLEAYRECLRDVFDMPALVDTLERMERREIRVATVDSTQASPFAAALLFGYVANYLYDGDAPLAERRAQALSIDQAQLRELLGDAELRDLLDADVLSEVEEELQQLHEDRRARTVDGVHDLLLRLGDLTVEEIDARAKIDGRRATDGSAESSPRDRGHPCRTVQDHPGRVRESVPRRFRRATAAGPAGAHCWSTRQTARRMWFGASPVPTVLLRLQNSRRAMRWLDRRPRPC